MESGVVTHSTLLSGIKPNQDSESPIRRVENLKWNHTSESDFAVLLFFGRKGVSVEGATQSITMCSQQNDHPDDDDVSLPHCIASHHMMMRSNIEKEFYDLKFALFFSHEIAKNIFWTFDSNGKRKK